MIRPAAPLPFALVLGLVACGGSGDDGEEPGTELGPCVQGQFCESPLQCADGICVNPDQLDDTGFVSGASAVTQGGEEESTATMSGTSGVSASGSATMGDGSATNADSGDTPEIHCTNDGIGCFCGHSADWGPTGVACSEASLPSPANCCASEGWPGYGGCACWTNSCRTLSVDTCYCGPGLPDGMDQPVDTCYPPSTGGGTGSGVCCSDPSGGTCTCYAGLTQCLDGDFSVGQCTAGSIECGVDESDVAACN